MRILYVGPFALKSSNANALRVLGVSDSICQSGHEVIICPGLGGDESFLSSNRHYGKLRTKMLDEYGGGFFSGLAKGFRGLFLGDVTTNWIEKSDIKPDAVIIYGAHLGYSLRLLKYCSINKIKLYIDMVEWYDPRHLPGGLLGPYAMANEISMRWVAKKCDGFIVISEFLEKYFGRSGKKIIRVPPLFSDFPSRPVQFRELNKATNFCYVGTPGKKEEFSILFDSLMVLEESSIDFIMHIVGVAEIEFLHAYNNSGFLKLLKSNRVKFYGKVENSKAKNIVAACDFLTVFRRDARFSKAGFPSKVSESMCLGTPVIVNKFSNLSDYIVNDGNSLIVDDLSVPAVSKILIHAASMSSERVHKMQQEAFKSAKVFFNPMVYKDVINCFLNSGD